MARRSLPPPPDRDALPPTSDWWPPDSLASDIFRMDTVLWEFADQLNALGIGGTLPRECFEHPIAKALNLTNLNHQPEKIAVRAREYADKVAALVGDGWAPAGALRTLFSELQVSTPQLRTSEYARAEVARMLRSASEAADPVGKLSEADMLSNLAPTRYESAPDPMERLSDSQVSMFLAVYRELFWVHMDSRGVLPPAGYEAVRAAIVAVFSGFAGPRR